MLVNAVNVWYTAGNVRDLAVNSVASTAFYDVTVVKTRFSDVKSELDVASMGNGRSIIGHVVLTEVSDGVKSVNNGLTCFELKLVLVPASGVIAKKDFVSDHGVSPY